MDLNLGLYTIVELRKFAKENNLRFSHSLTKAQLLTLIKNNLSIKQKSPISEQSIYRLENLPRDLQFELLSQLDLSQLQQICQQNTKYRNLCQNEQLWQQLVQRYFGYYSKFAPTWRQTFIRLYQMQKYIDLFGDLNNFLTDRFLHLIRSVDSNNKFNIETYLSDIPNYLASDPVADLTLRQDVVESSYPALEQFYRSLLNNRSNLTTPIPGLHNVNVEKVNMTGGVLGNVSNEITQINKYEITLLDLINSLGSTNLRDASLSYNENNNTIYLIY